MSLSQFARQHNERFARQRSRAEAVVPEIEPELAACAVTVPVTPLSVPLTADAPRPKLFREELPPDTDKHVLVADLLSRVWTHWDRDTRCCSWKEEFDAYPILKTDLWWLPMPSLPKKDG